MNAARDELRKLLEGKRGRINPLSASEIDSFVNYYDLVLKWNPLLHLTTLTSPADFAIRHLGESMIAEDLIADSITEFWDIGSGVGVPGLPVAIRRPDLPIRLIESNRRKAIFLDEAADRLNLPSVKVVNDRFANLAPPVDVGLTARAVERMGTVVDEILGLQSICRQFLLFGNRQLEAKLENRAVTGWILETVLLPDAKDRFLYNLRRST